MGEQNCLDPGTQQRKCPPLAFVHDAPPDSLNGINKRRIVQHNRFFTRRSPVPVNQSYRRSDKMFCQLLRIPDCCRTQNAHRIGSVKTGNPQQAAQQIRHVAAEYSAVLMHLVDNNIGKACKKSNPLRMVRQNPCMDHIGIGYNNPPFIPCILPERLRRVPVVYADAERNARTALTHHRVQFALLVLTQCFCRKQVQCPRFRPFKERLHHRQIVAQRLARSGRRNNHCMLPGAGRGIRFGLM